MSADNVITLPCIRVERLAARQPRCRAQQLSDITAALMQLCDDDKRILAHVLADELGYDLVPARGQPPRAG
jgi:hypothetical protein